MRTPYPNELRITNRETYSNELMHYGILGMKWGVRRYQNPDGTLTEAGKKRYGENLRNSANINKDVSKGRFDKDTYLKSAEKAGSQYEGIPGFKEGGWKYEVSYSPYFGEWATINRPVKVNGDEKQKCDMTIDLQVGPYGQKRNATAQEVAGTIQDSNRLLKKVEQSDSFIRNKVMAEFYDEYADNWIRPIGMDRSTFEKQVKLQSIFISANESTAEFSYHPDDSNLLGGHSIDAEVDLKTGKVGYISMNG